MEDTSAQMVDVSSRLTSQRSLADICLEDSLVNFHLGSKVNTGTGSLSSVNASGMTRV